MHFPCRDTAILNILAASAKGSAGARPAKRNLGERLSFLTALYAIREKQTRHLNACSLDIVCTNVRQDLSLRDAI